MADTTASLAATSPGPTSDLGAVNYQASRRLVTPERLRSFFAPRNVALVGASDNSGWTRLVVNSVAVTGAEGKLLPVHPKAKSAFGLPTVPSLRDLPEPADLAFVMTPPSAVPSVFEDMHAAGIKNAIVLAAGYREVGEAGRALEDAMVASAIANDITVLGPNCLGFVNAQTKSAPYALGIQPPLTPGPVGVGLQSGALASVVLSFARLHAIGLTTLTSVGNECMLKTADFIDYLVEDQATKVIALFLEEIGDPARFAAVAEKADRAGKPIVALKAGSSPAGQKSALAHTGSVAGDDAVVNAAFHQLNIVRVDTIEDLLTTAALLGYTRPLTGRRMGVLTASGGACDIIADASSAHGIEIPDFSVRTEEAIGAYLPPFANAHNPLDVTAYGSLANLSGKKDSLSAIDRSLDIAADDPNLDFILFTATLPEVRPPDEALATAAEARIKWLAGRIASSPIPVIPITTTCNDISGYSRGLLADSGLTVLGGLHLGVNAMGNALRWQENRGRVKAAAGAAPTRPVPVTGPWSEQQARELLTAAGVPVVPGGLATSADEAVAIADRVGGPVALKICSAQIIHKSDIGGVALGLSSAGEIRAAYARVRAAGDAVPGAAVDGVLVTAMRSGGTELLAGVTVDPSFGPVLAVGLGGVWVEIMHDTSLRVLPVDAAEVRRMLGELRALPLLQGARGSKPADLDAVAAAISKVSEVALSLGGALRAMEVNPLWVNGDQVEALDVLVITEPDSSSETEPAGSPGTE
jgi:acetate---CoA ligase (ADP-forming)